MLGNVWPAYLFALPLGARLWGLLGTPRAASFHAQAALLQECVTVLFLTLIVVLFAVRRRQIQGQHTRLGPGLVALAGTFLLNVVAYLPIEPTTSTGSLLVASGVVILGTLFTIWSLAALGRCFGLFPEVRGLVVHGPYRLVRHPVYVGELISALGLLLARPHPLVVGVLVMFVALQYGRTVYEERALAAIYPVEYRAYARRVPRLLPRWLGDDGWWFGGALCVVMVLCGLPYLVSALAGPADLERIGTFWFSRDFSQYEAAMREGASETGWLIHDHFSAEPHAAALMYPLYVAMGKLAALAGASALTLFAAAEWLGRLAVLAAVYAFARAFLVDRRQRHLAVLLSLGTLGLDAPAAAAGMALNALGVPAQAGVFPDRINPYLEMSSFGVLLSAPHLMFGLALTLVCAPLYLRAINGAWSRLALLAAAVLGLSLVHSFNAPVLVSVLIVHAALTGRRAWPAAGIACLAAAPMTVYSLLVFQSDAFWSGTYSLQNAMPAPAPWSLPVDFGVVLLAAPLAWQAVRRWPVERRRLILLWIGLGLIWMYAPLPYQRRFAFGVQPGLAVLAAVGLVGLNATLRARRAGRLTRRIVNYGVVLVATSTSILLYTSLLRSAVDNRPAEVYLWSRPEAAAAAWLGDHGTAADVVLASTAFANPLAGAIDGRVVHGHIVATLHSPEKEALVQRFYAADTSPLERSALLHTSGATFVALGPEERALGAVGLGNQPDLDLVYDRLGVELFRVR